MYKYYTDVLNLSAGPTLDFYLGWKQNDGGSVRIENFDFNPKVKVGFLAKLGKFIPLNKQFLLEPELRLGSIQTFDEAVLEIAISGKYRF